MRIVIDMQGAQGLSRERGIGRYTLAFAKALASCRGQHEVILALNGAFPDSIMPIREAFKGLIPQDAIRVWQAPGFTNNSSGNIAWLRGCAERVREAFLTSLDPDIIYVASLFEGYHSDAVTSVHLLGAHTPVAVTVYDLIPLIYPTGFEEDRGLKPWYMEKIDHLRQADLWLSISDSSRDECIQYLKSPGHRVVNCGSDVDPIFRHLEVSAARANEVSSRYGLIKPFVMYTGGADRRKNIDGLIRAYAKLPLVVREEFQLAIVCDLLMSNKASLRRLAAKHGIHQCDLVLAGFVPEDDLATLYNLCSLFVFPSWHEGFGLPALEAMRCGAPVIGANTSSLPEVIGLPEALFDPYSDDSISQLMERALIDEGFRAQLIQHSQVQAQQFSWAKTAKTALAAMVSLVAEHQTKSVSLPLPEKRLRLAFVSAVTPTGFLPKEDDEWLLALAQHYDVDVIVEDLSALEQAIINYRPVKSADGFSANARAYDRIVYQLANSAQYTYILPLITQFPGVVVMHDIHLSAVLAYQATQQNDPCLYVRELYHSHGYQGVSAYERAEDKLATFLTHPCSLRVLQNGLGMIAPTQNVLKQVVHWFGDNLDKWQVLGATSDSENQISCDGGRNPYPWVAAIRAINHHQAVEKFYRPGNRALIDLQGSIGDLGPLGNNRSLVALSAGLAKSFPLKPTPKQLFVDVSEIVRHDAQTGIQRVVRSILKAWLSNPPLGYRVEPVYATKEVGYRYARKFTAAFLGAAVDALADEPIDYRYGDVFLGLDFDKDVAFRQRLFYRELRNFGVRVVFLVYDLLAVQMPQNFAGLGSKEDFYDWLEVVTDGDSAVCISKSVADDLANWVAKHRPAVTDHFKIDWFHLGADVTNSSPSQGVPDGAAEVLSHLESSTTFLMVGTLEPRKGHAQVLAAFERLWQEGADLNLVIVGKNGWLVRDLVKRLKRHPQLNKRLFWLEAISDEYLELVYAASACMIAASYGEGFGLPLIEAAQHGLPILARDIPVFREVAADYAHYFAGETPEALAHEIKLWLDLYRQKKHRQSTQMPRLTWQESAQRLIELCLPG